MNTGYYGRFAPSPTGPLHFGSLVSAVCSFLDARAVGGRWFVRIEDIDPPREITGASSLILHALDDFGLHWDGPVVYQSTRIDAYIDALESLTTRGMTYPCSCSRKDIRERNRHTPDLTIYPGTCRQGKYQANTAISRRLKIIGQPLTTFIDRHAGRQTENVAQQVGDFILQRNNGLFAYQLAVVVDDAYQGITHIVRGSDLLDNTPRQIYLQQQLSYSTPNYLHHSLALDSTNRKLSKQAFSPAIDPENKLQLLYEALVFLGQNPPPEIKEDTLGTLWQWAITHWNLSKLTPV
ncbi:MAG: tRNA glutamyl-Q(34) synthetase GluQRS [Gammaproteobacteria bacterium]